MEVGLQHLRLRPGGATELGRIRNLSSISTALAMPSSLSCKFVRIRSSHDFPHVSSLYVSVPSSGASAQPLIIVFNATLLDRALGSPQPCANFEEWIDVRHRAITTVYYNALNSTRAATPLLLELLVAT